MSVKKTSRHRLLFGPFIRRVGGVLVVTLLFSYLTAGAQINVETAINLGRSSLYYDDYVTAIARFNEVLLVRPRMAEVYYYRGYAKFSLEDYDGAETDCSEAVRLNPFRQEFSQLRGLCRINQGNYQGAADDYTRVLREMPDEQNSRYNRALCYVQMKDYDAAISDLQYATDRWPRMTRPYLVRAQVSLEQGDTLGAIYWTDSLLRINRRDRDALAFRGSLSLWQEDYQRADSFLTAAIAVGNVSSNNYIARAQARHALNRFNDALADYDQAIALVPQHFVAHYNRGLLRALIGADNDAIADFDFVLQQEPDNILALYNRALLNERTGNYGAAEADFTALLRAYPTFYAGYAARARCRRHQGKTALAAQDESVVRRADLDLIFGQAPRRKAVKAVRRRSDHELDRYQELVEVERDSARVYVSDVAGRIQNRPADHSPLPPFPTEELQRVLVERPTEPSANACLRYNSGCMHAEIGLTDSAIEDYTEALQLNPRLAQAWYNRALLYIREGRTSEASSDLSHAGELGIYQAYNLLKSLKQ